MGECERARVNGSTFGRDYFHDCSGALISVFKACSNTKKGREERV